MSKKDHLEFMIEKQLAARGIKDTRVLDAFRRVPRHEFVRAEDQDLAYADSALPVGHGQTISQPLIVALMTQALNLTGRESVLEIGTGTGYQTAILAEMAGEVFTVEKVAQLSVEAKKRLQKLGYRSIHYKIGDGTKGWPENAPYDAILVTAGGPQVPPSLYNQLATGGRMVIPAGDSYIQDLLLLKKTPQGKETVKLGKCAFVPLRGAEGWDEED
ncbi:MAG: protein-L-isoaspartate(D-aspartate) O-methyltransferase [Bacillota bacterium]|nr:protein-L-isoaspartate(D-aspartate) O-methyltransferase [Bacillota bacterium]MDW7684869.1 protein-L-isoaspartate(D-aspartate) O-methyltransferase [Bacillota bacterium]